MTNVLLAGATGYLGSYILKELEKRNYPVHAVTRSKNKLRDIDSNKTKVIFAKVTQPDNLLNICREIDVVISSVGITKQKDGLQNPVELLYQVFRTSRMMKDSLTVYIVNCVIFDRYRSGGV